MVMQTLADTQGPAQFLEGPPGVPGPRPLLKLGWAMGVSQCLHDHHIKRPFSEKSFNLMTMQTFFLPDGNAILLITCSVGIFIIYLQGGASRPRVST